ncbi:hypothetical protein GCM10010517_24140 [Streptosporangium fragile]|uniref:Secreted protein n=1 Tax=Streptosporangium fragile TaxID=46186 RepID=A0ABN3VXV5_9ACTN
MPASREPARAVPAMIARIVLMVVFLLCKGFRPVDTAYVRKPQAFLLRRNAHSRGKAHYYRFRPLPRAPTTVPTSSTTPHGPMTHSGHG